MKRLFFFDLDGTLIHQSTACLEIARQLGQEDRLHHLEMQFHTGALTTLGFAECLYEWWQIPSEDVLRGAFNATPFMEGIGETIAAIHAQDGLAVLITMAPEFFAHRMSIFGFDAVFASDFPKSAQAAIEPAKILQPSDKPRIAVDFIRSAGGSLEASYAFGDSTSDLLLFDLIPHTVAINGSPQIKARAQYDYTGRSIWDAFQMVSSNHPSV
jgi:phosphoserine phosphatase